MENDKRKSYTLEYKKAIIKESELDGNSINSISAKYGLDNTMVGRWKKLPAVVNPKAKRMKGAGRKPIIEELEGVLFDWVIDRRIQSLIVSRKMIQQMAVIFFDESRIEKEFKASAHWLDNFLKRYELSLRKSTTLYKLPDDVIINRVISFKNWVDEISWDSYNLKNIILMDETAVYFGEDSGTTIDRRGASSIYLPSTNYESCRVTVILAIRGDGSKMKPAIIIKGKDEKLINKSGHQIISSANAWSTQGVLRKWIFSAFNPFYKGQDRGIIVWDSASTHRAKEMKTYLKRNRIDQIMIPSGTTGYLQSLDLVINKPFKDYLRIEINDYIENRMARNERGNLIKPPLNEIER